MLHLTGFMGHQLSWLRASDLHSEGRQFESDMFQWVQQCRGQHVTRGYANCKKDIARGYGNIPRSTTRLLSLLQLTGDNQLENYKLKGG